jgi:hypothetical protein
MNNQPQTEITPKEFINAKGWFKYGLVGGGSFAISQPFETLSPELQQAYSKGREVVWSHWSLLL